MRTKYPWWLSKKAKRYLREEDIAERKWVAEARYKFWTETWPAMQWEIYNTEPMWKEFMGKHADQT